MAALVFNLPPEAALKRAASGAGEWTHERELLAQIAESNHVVIRAIELLRFQRAGKRAPKWERWVYHHPDRPATQKPNPLPVAKGLGALMNRLKGG